MIGSTISHYKILEKLGEGGMGIVYKANDLRLDRSVALKFLPSSFEADEDQKQRFFQEAKAASSLDHPNICTIHEIDETDDGQTFICMAHYEGETLKQKIGHGALNLAEAIAITIQVAKGLARAHERQIVHRDIKPANIIVADNDIVKIVDFGLAKLAGEARLTRTGIISGTVAYMSPEQARGEDIDHRTDIWSLGVVLYEMLTGQLPFRAEHDQAIIYMILNENPKPISELRDDILENLAHILHKALQKDRNERYQHMDELLADLRNIDEQTYVLPEKRAQVKITNDKRNIYTFTAIGVILVVAMLYYLIADRHQPTLIDEGKIFTKLAILPFDNLRKDPSIDFLGFSLADQIITKLGYIQSIVVRPSSSVQKYAATIIDLKKVAYELDVNVILTANYLKDGDRLRLNAQLVNVAKNEAVWQAPLDLRYTDIFSVQDSISNGIIHGLKLQLSTTEEARLNRDISTNPLAYEYFLRALAHKWITATDFEVAIQLLETSVKLDSGFAPSWAHLGNAYGLYQIETGADPKYHSLAENALKKALSINPELPWALYSLSEFYAYTGNLEEGIRSVKQALQVSPKSGLVFQSLGFISRYAGLLDLSQQAYERAMTLDSSDWNLSVSHNQLTKTLIYNNDYSMAVKSAEQSIQLSKAAGLTTWPMHVFYLGIANFYERDWENAFPIFDSCFALDRSNIWGIFGQAYKAAGKGDRQKLAELLQTLEASNIVDPEMNYRFVHFYCLAGNVEKALNALEKSAQGGFINYPYISTDPLIEGIRNRREYQTIMDRMETRHLAIKEQFGKKFW